MFTTLASGSRRKAIATASDVDETANAKHTSALTSDPRNTSGTDWAVGTRPNVRPHAARSSERGTPTSSPSATRSAAPPSGNACGSSDPAAASTAYR